MENTEPLPRHVKLRHRALAYVRRFGRQRQPVRAASRRSFTNGNEEHSINDSTGRRPIVRIASKRGFVDSGGIRIGNRKSFEQLNGLNSTLKEIKLNTRSRTASKARRKPNKTQENHNKRRHRFLASLQNHEERRFGMICGCGVEQDAFDPDTTSRNKDRSVDMHSVGALVARFDNGFGFTCASPVDCPPPLGLEPTRTVTTTLQLRSRDGKRSEKFTLSDNSGFSSTGLKRKVPSTSSGYPSHSPITPPSPFVNDFAPASTLRNTRSRSRVSVGCNGWFLNDDDPAIVGWYRRGEVKPHVTTMVSRESDADFGRNLLKRYKINPHVTGASPPALSPSGSLPDLN
ncbi:hypothetical protein F444_08359 [Phytophthora nicotianae P1976]|uniref:Uncharacterized protein n=1 Tax=Phytophthora nicotianae P1976 TaxID=1317066 RepID=A0A081ABH6_PHYNI|nr:hypothetical protein F444_08359 [Phytophthora nicotianae P1976]